MSTTAVVTNVTTAPKRARTPRELATITANAANQAKAAAEVKAKGFVSGDLKVENPTVNAQDRNLRAVRRVKNRATYQLVRRIHLLESAIKRTKADTKAGQRKIKVSNLKIAELTFALAVISEA
jgi:hypothetical protein